MPLLALLAPAAEANSANCSASSGPYPAHEDWALKPSGLDDGDKFRLLFATSGKRKANSITTSPYNTFVRNAAKGGHGKLTDACANKFNAIISTQYESARENTKTRATDTSASIWWLTGEKVADDYADFYDGTWDSRNAKNERGAKPDSARVWTGSTSSGGIHSTFYAGATFFGVIRAGLFTGDPLNQGRTASGALYRLYGLSPVFTVVNDPRLSLSLDKTSANEGNSNRSEVQVTVKLDKARSTDTTFKLCVKNTSTATFRTSTSTNDRDFDLLFNLGSQLTVDASNCHTATLKKNVRYGYFRMRIYGDTRQEAHEKVVLELKSPPSGVKIASSGGTATYTITNDDSEPTVTITGGATVSEGTNASFTVKSSHAPAQALSVKVNITEAEDATTEKNHVDAADEGVRTVTVAAGSTSQSFTVPTSEDWVDEPDGVITATVQAGTGYVVGSARSAHVNVEDDDTRGLELWPAPLRVQEEGVATYTVRLTSRPVNVPEGVTVTLKPSGDLTVDTNTSKAGNQTTLTFHASGVWQAGRTVLVSAGEDADSTDDVSTIGHEASGADYGSVTGSVTVTVADIDVPHLVVAPKKLSVAEGSSATFTVKLATEPSVDGTIAFASTNSDVTFSPTSLSFVKDANDSTRGWNKLRTVTFQAASDNDIGDDTATLTLTASGGDYQGKTATIAATVTDTTVPALTLSTSTLSVMEDASTTYTVALAAKPTGAVTVAIGSNNGDVTVDTDTDTSHNQNRLTFNATGSKLWNDPQTVTVNARGDANTANEAVTLTHTASGGGYGAVRKTLSGTVTDDGKKAVAFAQQRYSVIEGKGPLTVTLVLSEARSATTNVGVSATPLTATGNGVDYSGQTFTATFAAGSTSASFDIPITADNEMEDADGETFRLDIHDFDFPNDLKKVGSFSYVDIYDAASLSFTRPQMTTVFEGGRPLEFTLNARAPYFDEADGSHGFAHVRLSGRASSYSDYRIEYWYPGLGWNSSTRLIAIPAGTPSARVRITARDDGRTEGRETATLTLLELPQVYRDAGQPFYRAGNPRTVTFTVADHETVAPRVESIAHQDPATSTAVSPASLTWRVTFDEEVHDVDASDFTLTGTTATLDVERDTGSTFEVTASGGNLGSITGGQVVLGLARDNDITDGSGNAFSRWNEFTSTYWVHDGTTPPPGPTVTVEAELPGVAVTEGQRVSFLLPASPAPTADFPVNITVTQSGNVVSAATLSTNQSTIRRESGRGAVGPKTQGDAVDEPDGSVTVTLDSGTGYTVGSPSSATIVVRDDDPTVVSLARTGTGAVTEGGTVELNVTLARALVAGETIDVPLAIGGTGLTTGDWSLAPKSGATYTGVTLLDAGTTTPKVRFEGAGAQTATLELTATADGTAESTETFTIALGADSAFDDSSLGTNVGGGADPHSTDHTFDVTVNDGAGPPPATPAVEFASATSSAAEDAGTHNVTLDLAPAAPSGGLDIAYAVTGTATAGSGNDFTIQGSGTLSVGGGATTATIPIAINDDSTDDDAETVVLTLNSGTGYTLGGTSVHTLAIADNDDPVTPTTCVSATLLADVDNRIQAAGSTAGVERWTRVKNALTDQPNAITLAEVQTIYDRRTQSGWSTGQWDPVIEALECLEDTTTPASPQITVQGGSAVTEGGNAVFTVSASSGPAAALTVTLTVTDDASSDFLSASDEGEKTVTIAAGQTSATLTVATQNDSTDETDGSVTATVSSGTGYTVGSPSTATVAVSDNDPTPQGTPVVRIAAGAGVTEGGNAQFTLTASPAPTASITVSVAVTQSGNFAMSGQAGTRTVTIGTGGTATLTVATDDDSTDETNGSITATVQTGAGYTAHGTQNDATVAVDDNDTPVVSITAGPGVTEGSPAAFTVTADPPPAAPLDITLTITQSGDMAASDQTGSRNVTMPTTGTAAFTVPTDDDAAEEPAGAITATLAAGTGYSLAAAPANAASVAVADNDTPSTGPAISIADATAHESRRSMPFTLTLSEPMTWPVYVRYATRDSTPVSAVAGQDYLAYPRAWRLRARFQPGQTETTIWIPLYNDSHDEDAETFEVILYDAEVYNPDDSVSIADGLAIGTITNSDPMPAAFLSRFGRTVAQQALDGIESRITADRSPATSATIAGQALALGSAGQAAGSPLDDLMARQDPEGDPFGHHPPQPLSMTAREALLASSFTTTGETATGSLAIWGRAARDSFDGQEGTFTLDGTATTAMLGADYARDRWLLGLSLLHASGKGSYADTDVMPRPEGQVCPEGEEENIPCGEAIRAGDGKVKTSLTAVLPYASIAPSERLRLWAALGHGSGEVTLTPQTGGTLTADTSWQMAAAGLRAELSTTGSGTLAFTSDALWSRTRSEKTHALAASDATITRLRAGMEASWQIGLESGATLTPGLEVGARHDGGDAETGAGIELGASLGFRDPASGFSMDLSARKLIAHDDDEFEENGLAVSFTFDPRPDSARGLSVSLRQDAGKATGGVDTLFMPEVLAPGEDGGAATTAEAAYGLAALAGRFTIAPHARLRMDDDTRDTTIGWRLTPERGAPDLSLGLEATRREDGAAAPVHGVGVGLTLRW